MRRALTTALAAPVLLAGALLAAAPAARADGWTVNPAMTARVASNSNPHRLRHRVVPKRRHDLTCRVGYQPHQLSVDEL